MKNWKDEINKNQKLILYGIITLLIILASYSLFFKPMIASIGKTTPQVWQLRRNLNAARDSINSISKYKSGIEQVRGTLSQYKKKFSTKQEISALLKELSGLAAESGVKIIAIRPYSEVTASQAGVAAGTYQKKPISVSASCGYHQLGTFLNKLENHETFMRVTDLRIDANPQNLTEHMVYILLNTYVLSETGAQK